MPVQDLVAPRTGPSPRRPAGKVFTPLSERAFRLYFWARLLSWTGTAIAPVALAWAVLGQGGGATGLGIVLATGTAPQLLLLPVGGVAADRWPRTRVLTVTNTVCASAQTLAAVLLGSRTGGTWWLAVLSAVCGTASSFSVPAGAGVLPELVPNDLRQPANALLKLAQTTVKVGGPAFGALVVGATSPAWVIGWDALSFAGAALLISRLELSARAGGAGSDGFLRELLCGWQDFRSRRWLWVLVLQSAVVVPLWLIGYQVLGPVYGQRELGGVNGWGLVTAGFTGGLLLGSALGLWWQPARVGPACCAGTAAIALPLSLMAAGSSAGSLAAAAGVTGAVGSLSTLVWTSLVQARIPAERMSRALSYSALGQLVVLPLGYLLAGPAAQLLGLRPTLGAAALLVALAAMLPLSLPEIRQLRVFE